MSFVGVALDGSDQEFNEFIIDHQVTALPHITDGTHPVEVGQLFSNYSVNSVPTFVIIQGGGEYKLRSGWSESQFREDLDWLASA